jgi:hypothetical protein
MLLCLNLSRVFGLGMSLRVLGLRLKMRLTKPWPEPYTVNRRSPWGPRVHPITGQNGFHHGVDVELMLEVLNSQDDEWSDDDDIDDDWLCTP